ncbi:EF-hand domain-containing family member B-like [Anticarsia gemmatalis]|uniref:EF-hand domain-containing family member B-like n=1 Tax=Anticarsia gemmatalis TaxID=129554 RepID=UPI003F77487D
MPIECRRSTAGGKGNRGMFIERDSAVVAAGLPTRQQNEFVTDSLQHYLLQEEVDALIGDSYLPPPKPKPLPPLRKPRPRDTRNSGHYGDVAQIISGPVKTKFESVVEDLKETVYSSYWKSAVGKGPDPVPLLPDGFDVLAHTFGKVFKSDGRLYDIVMPKVPPPDKTPPSKQVAGYKSRNYCKPFNPNLIFGHRSCSDKRGTAVKYCVTDARVVAGVGNRAVLNAGQANHIFAKQQSLGQATAPNNNIKEVPEGYSFGKLKEPDNLPECMTTCDQNEGRYELRRCLKHLNTVRMCLFKRVPNTFFDKFYRTLKYYDTDKTGWLPKEIVYQQCRRNRVIFEPKIVERLLCLWGVYDGFRIEYKTFILTLNKREPTPELPKIPDFEPHCIDYSTTYTDMVKPGQTVDNPRMAGVPSGRYLDRDFPVTPEGCCSADNAYLPHESDARSVFNPSLLTNCFVNHRHMYEKQEPRNVRRVFEAAGEKFTDEKFDFIWKEAQKLHSQGWVCYETFRQTLEKDTEGKTKK